MAHGENTKFNIVFCISIELEAAVKEKDVATSECDQLRRRTEALMSDCEQEKRERFETKVSQSNINRVSILHK